MTAVLSPLRPVLPGRRSLLLLCLIAAACAGDDGKDGVDGSTPTTPLSRVLTKWEDGPGVNLEITGVSGATGPSNSFVPGDRIAVTFTAKRNDGSNWGLDELDHGHILVSGPTFNYQPVIAEQTDLFTASIDNGDGTYTYKFATAIPSTYLEPANDSSAFGPLDGELQGDPLLAGTYTIGMFGRWEYTVDGATFKEVGQATRDVLFGGETTTTAREVVKTDNCNQCHVALQAHDGEIRSAQLCVLCHTSGAEDTSGNGVSIDFRVMIHKLHDGAHLPSVLGVATNSDGSRNYAATKVPYEITDDEGEVTDFSDVAFPVWPNLNTPMPRDFGYSARSSTEKTLEATMLQGATQCSKCHGDPDDSGLLTGPLTAPAQGGLAFSQPSRRACGSCHDDIDWTLPYVANQLQMDPQSDDSSCLPCHAPSGVAGVGLPLSTAAAHLHPLNDATINPGVNFTITSVSGASGPGGNFANGDKPRIEFTVTDDDDNDVPLQTLDGTSTLLVGPTANYQHVFPFASPNGASSALPVDFAGRLQSSSTTNKGTMSKLVGATDSETLIVQFTPSSTAFTVTGTNSGLLGSGTLAAATSTNSDRSSISSVELAPGAVAETITVLFTNPTASSTTFAVTGSVSGAMGSGTMPAFINASTLFTSNDGKVSFIVSSGANAFASNQTIHLTIFRGGGANPVLFAIVVGRTSFAINDRIYYDTVADDSSYEFALPMDLPNEFLGDGNGSIGQVLTAANVPVYYGRQVLSERIALDASGPTTLIAASTERARYVDVAAIDSDLANGDNVVIDDGIASFEEYAQVGYIDSAKKRLWFRTPLRFSHAATTGTVQEVTLSFRQEGVNYTLDPATGTITSLAAFTTGNAIVMNYRTDGAFGWYRRAGDALQAVYVPPINDSPDLDSSWGEWSGLTYLSGTYSASIWGRKNKILGLQNEVQTYNGIGEASVASLLYGSAAAEEPHALVSSGANCESCHTMVGPFHGGNRRDFNTCVLCHGVAGNEDWPIYGTTVATAATTGTTIDFRGMLHKIHMGEELTNAATYEVLGFSSSSNKYGEVVFPAQAGHTMNCTKCHGSSSNWYAPSARQHPAQALPTRAWRSACGACHDSDAAGAHFDVMTAGGLESCEVCHGQGTEFSVEVVHKVR